MKLRFTNTDSTGRSATRAFTFTYDGERHSVAVSDDEESLVELPDRVGEYLAESNDHAIEQVSSSSHTETPTDGEVTDDTEAVEDTNDNEV